MPPKKRVTPVKTLVQQRFGARDVHWLGAKLTPYELTWADVLAYGMSDGTVRWKLEDTE